MGNLNEKYYDFGLYQQFDGMTPQEILENMRNARGKVLQNYTITWLDDAGALKRYYEWSDRVNAPYKEDLWNVVAKRAANINDARKDPETGEYVLDENGNYIYDNCERCWLGAINAPGAVYPWAVIEPSIPFTGVIKFEYKDGTVVYPWGSTPREFKNGFGCASIPSELGKPELKCDQYGNPVDGDPEHVVVKQDLKVTFIDTNGKENEGIWYLVKDEESWNNTYNECTLIDTTQAVYSYLPEHADPVKQPDTKWTYTFDKWVPDLVPVNGPATYKASYIATKK